MAGREIAVAPSGGRGGGKCVLKARNPAARPAARTLWPWCACGKLWPQCPTPCAVPKTTAAQIRAQVRDLRCLEARNRSPQLPGPQLARAASIVAAAIFFLSGHMLTQRAPGFPGHAGPRGPEAGGHAAVALRRLRKPRLPRRVTPRPGSALRRAGPPWHHSNYAPCQQRAHPPCALRPLLFAIAAGHMPWNRSWRTCWRPNRSAAQDAC